MSFCQYQDIGVLQAVFDVVPSIVPHKAPLNYVGNFVCCSYRVWGSFLGLLGLGHSKLA